MTELESQQWLDNKLQLYKENPKQTLEDILENMKDIQKQYQDSSESKVTTEILEKSLLLHCKFLTTVFEQMVEEYITVCVETDKGKALVWWTSLDNSSKEFITKTYSSYPKIDKHPSYLTPDEICELHKEYLRYECNI